MSHTEPSRPKRLAIVVPCYNESEVLPLSVPRLLAVCKKVRDTLALEPCVLFVDDGSADQTWDIIEREAQASPYVRGLKLAHNVGHQHALWAGMEWAVAHADVAVTIDADLQDDEHVILQMVRHYLDGADIVYGVREQRIGDGFFKRTTAQAYYRFMRAYGIDLVYNHADFRLLSNRALKALTAYSERNLFLRGMVRQLGLPSAVVTYNQNPRKAGTTKYPPRKMLSLAIDGLTSFSVRPIHLTFYAGIICMLIAVVTIIMAFVKHLMGHTITGWTSLIMSLWFIGGLVLMSLGIIGEYVGKIYIEVKQRPRYLIEKEVGDASEQ
ncbi:MAG: glycosyltransferase family 2 protein [Alloprevotella sp.]|nr:glycosyltransferase family 2 protein [Alloprevotella sp.]